PTKVGTTNKGHNRSAVKYNKFPYNQVTCVRVRHQQSRIVTSTDAIGKLSGGKVGGEFSKRF
ncbi:MAG: hypothetical protein KAG97_06375, partial [Victivallales bacterium]|nr:hypothetical protein [Victivallales bacterium]